MIRSVAYFPSYCALNSRPVMDAVLASLKSSGIHAQERGMSADAVIVWSVLWNGRMAGNQAIYQHYRESGRPVIVVDVGAIARGTTWKIAVNNINAEGYYGHQQDLDPDRPGQLGMQLQRNPNLRPAILVAAQHKKSLQLANVPCQERWIAERVREIRAVSDRPIVIRPHPRCPLDITLLPGGAEIEYPRQIPGSYDSFNIDYGYHAVLNYNSGPGVQAAMAGARPMVDVSSLAHPVSVAIQDINQPYTVDRERWLIEIAHTEYTIEEIAQGLWLKRLAPALE